MVHATRPIRDFVTGLSTWYIRRSRDRFKAGDKEAIATARYVFREFSKLIAPVMPFIAEEIYQKVKNIKDVLSVHLEEWPDGGKTDSHVLNNMTQVRNIVSLALELRQKANIKVRQPLALLKIKNKDLSDEYLEIIKDELNVKKVTVDESISEEVWLDTTLTPELEEEGRVRDAIRSVQEWRKEQGLKPGEVAQYSVSEGEKEFFAKHSEEIKKATNVEFN